MNTATTTTNAASLPATVAEEISTAATLIALLDINDKKLSVKQLTEKINEIVAHVNKMQPTNTVARDRGPKSEKDMSEEDARRVMLGDMKDVSHKAAAEKLGLSYGQIYSARKGFTFKAIYKEMIGGNKA